MFAVFHSVSVLVGVLTRSGGLSGLAAIGVWGLSSAVVGVRQGLKVMFQGEEVPAALKTSLDVAYYILPKTKDLASLNTTFLSRSHLSPQAAERVLPAEFLQVDWTFSIVTTALFALFMLALAVAFFRRRDY
jgi:ABC-type transport system involved in multi-copper enzyme maturation permease subunit